jgi:BarA-like signal transduction histidine kinase
VNDLPENSSASVRKFPSLPGTGLGEQINEQKAKAIGIKAFLMKPLTVNQLAKTVRAVLEEKSADN